MRTSILGHMVGLAVIALLAAGVMLELVHAANPTSFAARPSAPIRTHHRDAGATYTAYAYPPGIPAIAPTLSPNDPAQPTFTVGDIRAYMNAHPYPSADGSTPQVVHIGFMTAVQASALMNGESASRPPTALVAVVELHGNISRVVNGIAAGSGPGPVMGKPWPTPTPAHDAVTVFDAYTGNVLVDGYND